MSLFFFAYRYGEYKVCFCRGQRHYFTTKFEGIQSCVKRTFASHSRHRLDLVTSSCGPWQVRRTSRCRSGCAFVHYNTLCALLHSLWKRVCHLVIVFIIIAIIIDLLFKSSSLFNWLGTVVLHLHITSNFCTLALPEESEDTLAVGLVHQ